MKSTNQAYHKLQSYNPVSINRLTDQELNGKLQVFVRGLSIHSDNLNIDWKDLEYLQRQQLSLDWMLKVKQQLEANLEEIENAKYAIRIGNDKAPRLGFFDLPRPPIFYPEGNINVRFELIIRKLMASKNYTPAIGRELGIE